MTADDLEAWRHRHALTLTAAADAMGVPWRTLRNWTTGRIAVPGWVPVMCRYIDRFGVIKEPSNA